MTRTRTLTSRNAMTIAAAAVIFSSNLRAKADEPARVPPPRSFAGKLAGFAASR